MPKTVIADAGYGSEENYVYAVGEEKEPRFDFLIPYGSYLQEWTRKYKKDIKNTKNWAYCEQDGYFICPNGRKVTFRKKQDKKNKSGYVQTYKIYECEDCTDCPLKAKCTKAKGQWNTVFEEMKAKAKTALEWEEKPAIYAKAQNGGRKCVQSHQGQPVVPQIFTTGAYIEFGIVALPHNILKVAGLRHLLSENNPKNKKVSGENECFHSTCFIF